jgi:hypothetical protein
MLLGGNFTKATCMIPAFRGYLARCVVVTCYKCRYPEYIAFFRTTVFFLIMAMTRKLDSQNLLLQQPGNGRSAVSLSEQVLVSNLLPRRQLDPVEWRSAQ